MFVNVNPEGASARTPSCGSVIVPATGTEYDVHVDSIECNARHIRQLGYVGLVVTFAVACALFSFLTRAERKTPEAEVAPEAQERTES